MLAIVRIGAVRRALGTTARTIRPGAQASGGERPRGRVPRRRGRTSIKSNGADPSVPLDLYGEFDPGSGRTLAARLTHASRTVNRASARGSVANGCVTRGQPAPHSGITPGNRS